MKKTILLLEDNLEMRENTAEIIEFAKYNVITASNGKEGVLLAQEHIPDLIICDIMMPEMDGYEVLSVLGNDSKTCAIPFVFLTAKAEKSEFRKGMNLGADDYITKPFEELDLLNAIKSRLERSELLKKGYDQNSAGITNFINDAQGLGALDKLSENKRIRHFKKKEVIFYEGDFANAIYFINSGRVRTYKVNDDAKEYSVALSGPGDFIGYLSILEGETYMESAESMDDIEILKIQKEEFTDLLFNNRDVSNRFVKMLAHNIIENEERLLNLAYNSVRKRVADSLIELEKKYRGESKDNFMISITRNELASLVGTSTETVIRTLSDFKDERLIEIKGSKITILKSKELENLRN
ncbi:MAG: transcriptional regulator [Flavobacteriales bacterium CG_4_9_14_3_um_filter_32_8]|nr:MAG: transcriptional regulator [Flavobacteriales bacterium CG_4_9_14_3_um_filter_32_8]